MFKIHMKLLSHQQLIIMYRILVFLIPKRCEQPENSTRLERILNIVNLILRMILTLLLIRQSL